VQHSRKRRFDPELELKERRKLLEEILPAERMAAVQKTRKRQEENKKETDQERFNIGDKVYKHRTNLKYSHSDKFTPKWDGPYKIIEVLDKGTYHLQTIEKSPRRLKNLIHGNRLQKCNRNVRRI
jgi:ParB-like chromosome segregation protein Spo0J